MTHVPPGNGASHGVAYAMFQLTPSYDDSTFGSTAMLSGGTLTPTPLPTVIACASTDDAANRLQIRIVIATVSRCVNGRTNSPPYTALERARSRPLRAVSLANFLLGWDR